MDAYSNKERLARLSIFHEWGCMLFAASQSASTVRAQLQIRESHNHQREQGISGLAPTVEVG
jgi:hypothetical protein